MLRDRGHNLLRGHVIPILFVQHNRFFLCCGHLFFLGQPSGQILEEGGSLVLYLVFLYVKILTLAAIDSIDTVCIFLGYSHTLALQWRGLLGGTTIRLAIEDGINESLLVVIKLIGDTKRLGDIFQFGNILGQ